MSENGIDSPSQDPAAPDEITSDDISDLENMSNEDGTGTGDDDNTNNN